MLDCSSSTWRRDNSCASAMRSSGKPPKPAARAKRTTLACDVPAVAATVATVASSIPAGSPMTVCATLASAGRRVAATVRM